MESIFSKNGILAGRLNYYCLVCDANFTNEDSILAHILDSTHKGALKTCGYVEKYEKNFIRKTKGIYFCEPCNLTIPTAPKVDLHLREKTHQDNRNKINPLNRVNHQVIAFNRFKISDGAWNGCIEDTCVLCNTEFDDYAAHCANRSHVINLIKSEVIFDDFIETVYRKIDETSKQCLTCNKLIGNDNIASHFASTEHREACKRFDAANLKETTQNCETPTETQNGTFNDKTGKKDGNAVVNGNVNEEVSKEADNNGNKDVKKDQDVKKETKAESSKPEKEAVRRKPKQTVKRENAKELDKIYCKNLGARNYVTGEFGERWCVLCEWLLEESTGDHIRSKHHQNLLKLHNERIAETNNNNLDDEGSIPYESVERYQKSNVNIDLINVTAFCKKCSKNIDFDTTAIEKHIEEHNKTPSRKSPETLASGIKSNGTEKTTLYTKPVLLKKDKRSPKTVSVGEYAKQHGFTHNVADCSYYCRPCSRRLNTTLEDLQKHVASKTHMENTKQSSSTAANKAPVKEPLFNHIKSFELIESMTEGCIVVINEKFWLNAFGFMLIAKMNERIFCHCCHIDLTDENVVQHIISDYHRGIVGKCLLITSLEDEFIREIKLDEYHCGYCNHTENDWDDIVDHIGTAEHKKEKASAERSLREHQPNFFHPHNMRDIDEMVRQFVRHNT